MDEGRAALVHQLRLPLRIEILREIAHDAQKLALPVTQSEAVLLQKIEEVLLRQPQAALALARLLLAEVCIARRRGAGHGAPEIAILARLALQPLEPSTLVFSQFQPGGAAIAEDPLAHQRMRRVERRLDGFDAVALLASRDVALGEIEIVENSGRVGPLLEEIVVLEEVVVAEGGMRDDDGLHRHRVLLHAIADARIAVDDDLVGQRLIALAVKDLVAHEAFAVGPMRVHEWHADRGIGVEHLLGRNDLDLIGKDVEPELLLGDDLDRLVNAPHRCEVPVGAVEEECAAARGRAGSRRRRGHVEALCFGCLAKSLRKTG